MLSSQIPQLYITETEKGRGVFTALDIEANNIIETCPVIILDSQDKNLIHQTLLHDYYFMWDLEKDSCAIALGYGSIYNHADSPNAEFSIRKEDEQLIFRSLRNIKAGEEITVKYINIDDPDYRLWFEKAKQ